MKTLEKITINNYDVLEDNECKVGDTIVSFTCESEGSCNEDCEDDEYPYKYIVSVEHNGKTAEGYAWQRNEYESAYHDGFESAYRKACRTLNITPMLG